MRNTKIQVFLDPREYLELVSFAKEHQLDTKTDSRLMLSLINFLKGTYENQSLTTYAMQQQINKQKDELMKKDEIIQKLKDDLFRRKKK